MESSSYENLDDLILLKIFSYLPSKYLLGCMRVCKKWNKMVHEVIKQRECYPQTLIYLLNDNCDKVQDFNEKISSELEKIWCKPALSLFFLNKPANLDSLLASNESAHNSDFQRSKRLKTGKKTATFLSLLKNKLSLNLPKLFIVGDGIIGSNENSGLEIESDCEQPALSGLFVPENVNYRIEFKPIHFKKNLPELKTEQDLDNFLGVKKNEEIRFLLLLVDGYSDSKLIPLLDNLNQIRKLKLEKNVKKSFACTGGIVKRMDDCSGQRTKLVFLSLISNVDFQCKVSQIVVREPTQQEFSDVWNEKIDLMKKSGVYSNRERCLAFQVSCCGRGKDYHHQKNFESNLFLKEFPNVPLVGFFGYGEIGVDYLPDYRTDSNKNFIDNVKNREMMFENILATGFTTIFTLISFQI
ncbi:F-box only 22 [Brachionus plicatilis]|uniref:F-box only 22 n=1 Tax=Brachionus plicatilis TaxID=10195 RepID=A0A3M7PL57_BRAPC|nr:F-box only 22 [Brachionus plicatilis]